MSIAGPGAAQQGAKAMQQQSAESAKEMIKVLGEAAHEIANNAKELSEELSGKFIIKDDKQKTALKSQLEHLEKALSKEVPDAIKDAMAAILSSQDELEKNRRKRKKFEEKCSEISELLGRLDSSQLSEDQKKDRNRTKS